MNARLTKKSICRLGGLGIMDQLGLRSRERSLNVDSTRGKHGNRLGGHVNRLGLRSKKRSLIVVSTRGEQGNRLDRGLRRSCSTSGIIDALDFHG